MFLFIIYSNTTVNKERLDYEIMNDASNLTYKELVLVKVLSLKVRIPTANFMNLFHTQSQLSDPKRKLFPYA